MSLRTKEEVIDVIWLLVVALFWSGPLLFTLATVIGPNRFDAEAWRAVEHAWLRAIVLYLLWDHLRDKETK